MTDKTFDAIQKALGLIKAGRDAEAQKLLQALKTPAVESAIADLVTMLDRRGEGDNVKPVTRLLAAEIMSRPRRRR